MPGQEGRIRPQHLPGHADVTYPDVTVHLSTGHDGNAGTIIATVSRAIRRHDGTTAAVEFVSQATNSASYDDLLRFVMRTVNVT